MSRALERYLHRPAFLFVESRTFPMDNIVRISMPAMQELVEVWGVLNDADKDLVSDFFNQWTGLWAKWSVFMEAAQQQNFFAHMNAELCEQVAAFRCCYVKQLATAARYPSERSQCPCTPAGAAFLA